MSESEGKDAKATGREGRRRQGKLLIFSRHKNCHVSEPEAESGADSQGTKGIL